MSERGPASAAGLGGEDFDVVVVGSGFGGSVAALRLTEKGYRVAVLEAGRRFEPWQLPTTSWDIRRFVWAPALGCFGIQRAHFLKDVIVLAGAGVGGGSLNYANTLYEPQPAFYRDRQWASLGDWQAELAPFYDQARRMLGVSDNPFMSPADEAMLAVARELGVEDSFRLAPVGVCFGPPGARPGSSVGDPYFGGAGPERRACLHCGECMTGCRHGAKNTLLTNYLYLAEKAGAVIIPMTTVSRLSPGDDGRWEVLAEPTGRLARRLGAGRRGALSFRAEPLSFRAEPLFFRAEPLSFRAEHVVLAAGTWGTQRLLHSMALDGLLPGLSPTLGRLTRTNSESLLGAVVPFAKSRPGAPNYSRGVAITSSFYPEPGTHVEPVRYGRGSSLMGLFGTLLVSPAKEPEGPSAAVQGKAGQDGPGPGRSGRRPAAKAGERLTWRAVLAAMARDPKGLISPLDLRRWSERTIIALVMQAKDNSITVSAKKGWGGRARLTSSQGHGEPNPVRLAVAHETVRRLAQVIGGRAAGNWGELLGRPMTAHFIGGCVIGTSVEDGVIDPWHRVFNHPGLHVVDGSALPANPGANPSLTITAMAERAFAYWPNRGQPDPRPPLAPRAAPVAGSSAVAVRPLKPAVPATAPGALRIGPARP